MRFRLPLRRTVFFVATLAVALIVLLPLRVAAGWFDMGGKGLAARAVEGSLWMGHLREAQFGPVQLGDVDARLNVLPLLLGRARLSLHRDEAAGGALDGALLVTRHRFGIEDMTGQFRTGALFGPLTITMLDLSEVSVNFEDGVARAPRARSARRCRARSPASACRPASAARCAARMAQRRCR